MNKIYRLYTYINTYKSLELLNIYLDKINNGKSTHLRFIDEFDLTSLDLLFTAIKYKNINNINVSKLDRKELNYYIKKGKGITYFSKQNKSISDKKDLINYLVNKLNKGDYYFDFEGIVRIGNVLINKEWLLEISEFLVNSYYLEEFISDNRKLFSYTIYDNGTYYEYNIEKNKKEEITYHEELYLYDLLKNITKYDFKELKNINRLLHKDGYVLSVNKNSKSRLISNRNNYIMARDMNEMYELYRSIAHAYQDRCSINKCRKLISSDNKKYMELVYMYVLYYLEYLYDYDRVNKYLDYENVNIYKVKPSIINYYNREYKKTLCKLVKKKKEIVKQNKIIDLCLMDNYKSIDVLKNKGYKLSKEANKLTMLVTNKKELQSKLDVLSKLDGNSKQVLFDNITKGLFTYSYRYKNRVLEITLYDKNVIIFGIEIRIDDLKKILSNEDNLINRVKVYEKG